MSGHEQRHDHSSAIAVNLPIRLWAVPRQTHLPASREPRTGTGKRLESMHGATVPDCPSLQRKGSHAMKRRKCGNELATGDAPNSAQCRRCEQASISSSLAPACSPDEWRILAIAALNLAGELVAELRRKCNEPLHAMQAEEIASLLKQYTAKRASG